jgi:hypothetical protein
VRIRREADPRNPVPPDLQARADAVFAAVDAFFKTKAGGEMVLSISNGKATDITFVKDTNGPIKL